MGGRNPIKGGKGFLPLLFGKVMVVGWMPKKEQKGRGRISLLLLLLFNQEFVSSQIRGFFLLHLTKQRNKGGGGGGGGGGGSGGGGGVSEHS